MKTSRPLLLTFLAFGAATLGIACSGASSGESTTHASPDGGSGVDASLDANSAVDAHVGECASGDIRACCAARGSQTCDGTGAWSACDVVATPETCNGVDDDCDGEVDESLTVACVPDQDGDRYAGGTNVTSQCADLGRAAWGNCPAGFVDPVSKLGDDCNDADATMFQMLSARIDADADAYCVSTASTVCSGSAVPAGYRATALCQATDDCDDVNPLLYRTAALRIDGDGDGYCTSAAVYAACVGATLPAGTRLAATCNATNDCKDDNLHATTTCSASASSNTVDKICDVGFAVTTSASFTWSCPVGFVTQSAYLLDDNGADGDNAFYSNETYSLAAGTATSDLVCRVAALGHDYYHVGANCVAQ